MQRGNRHAYAAVGIDLQKLNCWINITFVLVPQTHICILVFFCVFFQQQHSLFGFNTQKWLWKQIKIQRSRAIWWSSYHDKGYQGNVNEYNRQIPDTRNLLVLKNAVYFFSDENKNLNMHFFSWSTHWALDFLRDRHSIVTSRLTVPQTNKMLEYILLPQFPLALQKNIVLSILNNLLALLLYHLYP